MISFAINTTTVLLDSFKMNLPNPEDVKKFSSVNLTNKVKEAQKESFRKIKAIVCKKQK